jgi:putative transposase
VDNRYHLFLWQRVYVFNCDYWFAYKICFELERKQQWSADWCADILQETIQKYGVPEIFNTDQGSQYTSEVHTNVLLNNGIKFLWTVRSYWQHFIERLWRTVKYENVYLQAYTDGISLYRGLKDYFEFYNTRRLHQSLDYGT